MAPVDPHPRYSACRRELLSLLQGEDDLVARMSSTTAVLRRHLPQASFVGFYRVVAPGLLVVGPYQGPPACLRIPFGRGVCGTAAREDRSILVPDVGAFPGHIACDAEARSELVVVVHDGDHRLIAVLDCDSHAPAGFDEIDREEIEALLGVVFGSSASVD